MGPGKRKGFCTLSAPKRDWARAKALAILSECNNQGSYNPECLTNLISEALRETAKIKWPTGEEVSKWCTKECIYEVPINFFYTWLKSRFK